MKLIILTLATLSAVGASAQSPGPSFFARQDYFAGSPNNVVIADVNNDGIPDVISDGPDVFLGNGDGTFRPVTQPNNAAIKFTRFGPATTKSATLMAIADVNGDGNPDIVFSPFSNQVYVILGFGDGTFQDPNAVTTVYTIPGPAFSLAVADLNHDGHPDIVVGGTGVSILTNQGDGAFLQTAEYLPGKSVGAVTVQDINGDRLPDIAAGVGDKTVAFLLGTATGKFRAGSTLTTPTVPGSLFFADFSGDGILDLAVGGSVWVSSSSQITIFPGTGGGSFGPPQVAISFPVIAQIAVGDVNHDGHPDIIALENDPDVVAVYINNGDGTFKAPRHYSAVGGATDLAVAPLRKAGLDDIVVAGSFGFSISILLNEGNGTFQDGLHIPLAAQPGPLVTADFNHDGLDDLATITSAGVEIFLANGKTLVPFTAGTTIALPATSLIEGDFNNDGIPDLAMGLATNQIAIVFGNGDGTFGAPVYSLPGGVSTNGSLLIWAGDFNGDGKLDLATSFNSYLLGEGNGAFHSSKAILPQTIIATHGPITAIGAGDLNGDGVSDMIVSLNADSAYVFSLLGSTTGALTQAGMLYSYNFGLNQIVISDVNGDGIPDAVVGSLYGAGYFLGIGNGALQPTAVTFGSPPITTYAIAVGDFNNDGIPDIAVSTYGESSIALYVGTGGGSFTTPTYWGTAPGSTWVVKGHFHGTRAQYPDLAVPSIDGIYVLLNTTR